MAGEKGQKERRQPFQPAFWKVVQVSCRASAARLEG